MVTLIELHDDSSDAENPFAFFIVKGEMPDDVVEEVKREVQRIIHERAEEDDYLSYIDIESAFIELMKQKGYDVISYDTVHYVHLEVP